MIRLAWFLSLTSPLLFVAATSAQDAERRIITATGTATVRFKPDSVRIQCGVRTSDLSADAAKDGTQKAGKVLSESLTALKLKDLKISTAPMTITQGAVSGRRFGQGGGGGGVPMGVADARPYTAIEPVTIVLNESDVDKLKESIEKIGKVLIETGANTSGGEAPEDSPFVSPRYAFTDNPIVTLLRRDDAEYRDEATSQAVQKAMRTAKALAKGAGVQIKETVSISESEYNSPDGYPVRYASSSRSISGELEITVRVTVRCSY